MGVIIRTFLQSIFIIFALSFRLRSQVKKNVFSTNNEELTSILNILYIVTNCVDLVTGYDVICELPGQECNDSCAKRSQSEQKIFRHSGH